MRSGNDGAEFAAEVNLLCAAANGARGAFWADRADRFDVGVRYDSAAWLIEATRA